MKPLVRLTKRGKTWAVVMRSNRAVFSSSCYAKVVGVFEYLESRRKEQEAETRHARAKLHAELSASMRVEGGKS